MDSDFVAGWLRAWNAHDIEAVLSHFADDVEFRSPVAARVLPETGGVCRGKDARRHYWRTALAAVPDLRFELVDTYVGVDTLVVTCRNQLGGLVNEVLVFRDGLVVAGYGTYRTSSEAADERPPTLRGAACTLVPVAPEHVAELRRIRRTPEVQARWGVEDLDPPWPFGGSSVHLSVLVDDAVRGLVQYHEDPDPQYRSAGIDIFLDPAVYGRGIARDAVGTLVRHLVDERGHHRLTIDPAVDNEPAIRAYAAVGFRPVGIMRRYERDHDGTGYHDGLLMDLLAEDLPARR